jgi:hypothetical protein
VRVDHGGPPGPLHEPAYIPMNSYGSVGSDLEPPEPFEPPGSRGSYALAPDPSRLSFLMDGETADWPKAVAEELLFSN